MADILIKGLSLPKKGNALVQLSANGDVWVSNRNDEGTGIIIAKAVALSEYGRLIDADAEIAKIKAFMKVLNKETESGRRQYHECDCVLRYLIDAPTIVEATE